MNKDREGARRSSDLYNVSKFTRKSTERWKMALFSLFILAPPPLPPTRGPISGHSHAWGPGTEQTSWSRTSRPSSGLGTPGAPPSLFRGPVSDLHPPGPGEEAGWKLVGNRVASPTHHPMGSDGCPAPNQAGQDKVQVQVPVGQQSRSHQVSTLLSALHTPGAGGGGGWPWWQCRVGALRQAWNAFT